MRLLDAFEGLFGRFFRLAGSATLVTAVLVFAGFLSDFGAYRLAGLPRLNMTVTALVEQGADTLIDSIALLGAGHRGWVLGAALLGVVLAWGWRDGKRLQPWSLSVDFYHLLRLFLLFLAIVLTGALFERSQRSLSSDQHGPQAIDAALRSVYETGKDFPTTYDREMAIQEQTYGVRGPLYFLNMIARVEARDDHQADNITGLPLRPIAEARAAARHVYGWLVLLALLLTTGLVLLLWWGKALGQTQPDQPTEPPKADASPAAEAVTPTQPATTAEVSDPLLLRTLKWCMGGLGKTAQWPIEQLLAPLSLLLAVLSLGLLPLTHGLLARPSLGAETVMVYLDPGGTDIKATVERVDESGKTKTTRKDETNSQDVPDSTAPGPKARLDCTADLEAGLAKPMDQYRKARREVLHQRPPGERFDAAMKVFAEKSQALSRAVIDAHCAEAVAVFWAARPSDGTRARQPDMAEAYFRAFRAVQAAYSVRVGTLLGYPRDGQGLTLADSIVPLPLPRGGRSSIVEVARSDVQESVVLPDLDRLALDDIQRHLVVDPDSNATAERMLLADNAKGLGFMADMLRSQRLHASAAGVTVSSMGTMARSVAHSDPATADRGISLLAELATRGPTPWWPGKTDEIRGTAISSLHLTRLPYAAHKFIALMRREPVPASGCPDAAASDPAPAACLSTVPTAAGFLLQDVVAEIHLFASVAEHYSRDTADAPAAAGASAQAVTRFQRVPDKLTTARDELVKLLVDLAVQANVSDEVRGTACTALGRGGKSRVNTSVAERFLNNVLQQAADSLPISAYGCIQVLTVLGLPDSQLRPALRAMARGQNLGSKNPAMVGRLRAVALVALGDLDVAQEYELLFDLYLEQAGSAPQQQRLGRAVAQLLDDVAPEPMARKLWQCASDSTRPDPLRDHCLMGFAGLDDDYDGDDGHAGKIFNLLASGQAPRGRGGCQALLALMERGSSTLVRVPDDHPVMQACGAGKKR